MSRHVETPREQPSATSDTELTIDVDTLRARLESGEPTFVLDVRPVAERAEWAIPGSAHFDAYQALRAGDPNALCAITPPFGTPVVTVCAAGKTSRIAAEQLRERGMTAWSLKGGMKAWSLAWNTAELATEDATLVQVRRTGKGCLSYLVASGTEAVVIDASLDPEIYLCLAQARGWTIRHVLDTHIHADHLSRTRVLAERAGASLWLPEQRRVGFSYRPLQEGAEFHFGASILRGLSTPGHTQESMCYLVDDRWLLTGDTLFVAGVGRPDLEASGNEKRARAVLLHNSLRRLFELDPRLLVLPCHTTSPVPFDQTVVGATLGAVHDAIQLPEDAAGFADRVLQRIPATPPNHHAIVERNEAGELPPGDPTDLEAGANRCAVE